MQEKILSLQIKFIQDQFTLFCFCPTGLIIVQMLVKSDKRIEQVFNHYGGDRLLMAMVKFTSGDLRKQVLSTLKSITHGKTITL